MILVVEDNAIVRNLFGEIAKLSGYQVKSAKNAAEATEILDNTPLDAWAAVVLDLGLPDKHGLYVAQHIRKLEGATPRIPIIAVTGGCNFKEMPYEEVLDLLREAAVNVYLQKPLLPRQLVAVLINYARPPARPPTVIPVSPSIEGD